MKEPCELQRLTAGTQCPLSHSRTQNVDLAHLSESSHVPVLLKNILEERSVLSPHALCHASDAVRASCLQGIANIGEGPAENVLSNAVYALHNITISSYSGIKQLEKTWIHVSQSFPSCRARWSKHSKQVPIPKPSECLLKSEIYGTRLLQQEMQHRHGI
jgi:hypothetical protein